MHAHIINTCRSSADVYAQKLTHANPVLVCMHISMQVFISISAAKGVYEDKNISILTCKGLTEVSIYINTYKNLI